MLEQTEWMRVNKSCYTLVDADQRVIATVFTSYNEDDGDELFVWSAEIEDESLGDFISLYAAKLAVQRAIADWEDKQAAAKKPKVVKKPQPKRVKKAKASVSRKK